MERVSDRLRMQTNELGHRFMKISPREFRYDGFVRAERPLASRVQSIKDGYMKSRDITPL